MKNPADEIVQIVDEKNQVAGSCPRGVMRAERLIHRACYILVFNRKGELFVQKRSIIKDVYPGHWDVAAGGVVLAGESYEQAAGRELLEELGIQDVPLTFLFDNYYEDEHNRVWGRIFTCFHDGPFTLQAEEIDHGRFMGMEEALALSKTEPFTPDGVELLEKIQDIDGRKVHTPTLFLHGLDSSGRGTKGRFFSERFPATQAPDFTGSLDDRLQALKNICEDKDDLVLIGSSFGGLMAACFAATHPEKVKRIILLAPALNFPGYFPPDPPLLVPTLLITGQHDTVCPPNIVIPAARKSFTHIQITSCNDDHLLHNAFFALDWQRLMRNPV
jgi:8-oxo-dGTP pyrophosphatase MutT (NUDIX family)/predicted alpha/beta hydrolase family esterase